MGSIHFRHTTKQSTHSAPGCHTYAPHAQRAMLSISPGASHATAATDPVSWTCRLVACTMWLNLQHLRRRWSMIRAAGRSACRESSATWLWPRSRLPAPRSRICSFLDGIFNLDRPHPSSVQARRARSATRPRATLKCSLILWSQLSPQPLYFTLHSRLVEG